MSCGQSSDLEVSLASAGRDLEVESGSAVGSGSSEPRDQVDQAQRVEDELERRSISSGASSRRVSHSFASEGAADMDACSDAESVLSAGTLHSTRAVRSGVAASSAGAAGSALSLDSHAMLDKVDFAIAEAKRAAMEKATEKPGGSGSVSNVASSSTGSAPISALPSVLSQPALCALQPDKKAAVEKAVAAVVEKTGAELAKMQLELDRARETAVNEAREKAHLESRLAHVAPISAEKGELKEALHEAREEKIEIEGQRDDLKDKLVGMQTLMDVKVARHVQEKEALRQKTFALEEELKQQTDNDKGKLQEELTIAAKEMEKAKSNSIIASSQRDMLAHAELAAKRAHEAEVQAIKAEMFAAKIELQKHGIDMMEVLPIVEGEVDPHMGELGAQGEGTSAEKLLALKLREQKENNKRLHQEFEHLRLDMLNMHMDRESELAELKAKVEVQQILPKAQARARRLPKQRSPLQGGKLSAIDEEEDEDVASQAGSGVSAQVSSDCGGVGVGDLRDFDGLEESSLQLRSLREKLVASESWYRHLDDLKQAKEAEYQAKIQRLVEQVQYARLEAVENKDWARQLQVDKVEIEAQKHAEVANVKAELMDVKNDLSSFAGGNAKVQDLHEKMSAYAHQVCELMDQLAIATEEKRILNIRLVDMRRELEATEERHVRTIEQLRARLRHYGERDSSEGSSDDSDDWASKVRGLEEDRNLLRNELEAQQVHWRAQLEAEQHQSTAVLATLREERDIADKDRELKAKIEDSLVETQRSLKSTRQALADSEASLQAALARNAEKASVNRSILDFFRCPPRAGQAAPLGVHVPGDGSGSSCQSLVWQIMSAVSGVAALLCSGDGLVIRDASKKAFAMWGSGMLRGASLLKLIHDDGVAEWLQSELEAPATPVFTSIASSPGFWLRDLGFVEFKNRLGSAFDASVVCARLPEEVQHGKPPMVVVVVQTAIAEEQLGPQDHAQQLSPSGRAVGGHPLQPQQQQHSFFGQAHRGHHHGPGSVASSVHSEDITANDSVSNVNSRW